VTLTMLTSNAHIGGIMTSRLRLIVLVTALVAIARPASAQWTRVNQVPNSALSSVWANGDTIITSDDSAAYLSTDAGVTWKTTATVASGLEFIPRVVMRNRRLYAGTQRKGVFVSNDLGETWSDFNQGLVGGFLDSQLIIADMLIRGDSIYVATVGSGAWVRNLTSGTWRRYGDIFEPDQATNMTFIAAGPSRLLAGGGNNGFVFFRFPGQPDWTPSLLLNDRIGAGLAALNGIWTGTHWVVAVSDRVFVGDESGWRSVNPGLAGPQFFVPFAMHGGDLYAEFAAGLGSTIKVSHDEGSTWAPSDTFNVATSGLAVQGNTLYASRFDGLWRRPLQSVASVPDAGARSHLAFAIAGSHPIGDRVRFTFELPEAGPIAIDVFDIEGRRVGEPIREARPAGRGAVEWNAGHLAGGVYHARLTAPHGRATVRLVRTAGSH